jgi:small subunit ribosomal protein S3Ae
MPRKAVTRKPRKRSFTVMAPASLGGVELHEVLSNDGESLINRAYEPLLYDVTEDLQHQNIILRLKITKVEDEKAYTIFAGHSYVREYLRALIVRGTSFIKAFKDVETKDGYRYRVMVGAFTTKVINTSRMRAIRRIIFDVLERRAKNLDNDSFIKEILFEKLASEIYNAAKKIYPLRHVGIMKTKLLSLPETGKEVIVESLGVSGGEGKEA